MANQKPRGGVNKKKVSKDFEGRTRTSEINQQPVRNDKGQLAAQKNKPIGGRWDDGRKIHDARKGDEKKIKAFRGDYKKSSDVSTKDQANATRKGNKVRERSKAKSMEAREHEARSAALRAAFNVG